MCYLPGVSSRNLVRRTQMSKVFSADVVKPATRAGIATGDVAVDRSGGGGPHPTARLFVLSHRPAPEMTERQTLVTTGIVGAVAAAREAVPAPGVTHLQYEVAR
jgi:hypothetical protein